MDSNPLRLEFSGLGHFNNTVVFVKLKDGPAKELLHKIAGIVILVSRGLIPIVLQIATGELYALILAMSKEHLD